VEGEEGRAGVEDEDEVEVKGLSAWGAGRRRADQPK